MRVSAPAVPAILPRPASVPRTYSRAAGGGGVAVELASSARAMPRGRAGERRAPPPRAWPRRPGPWPRRLRGSRRRARAARPPPPGARSRTSGRARAAGRGRACASPRPAEPGRRRGRRASLRVRASQGAASAARRATTTAPSVVEPAVGDPHGGPADAVVGPDVRAPIRDADDDAALLAERERRHLVDELESSAVEGLGRRRAVPVDVDLVARRRPDRLRARPGLRPGVELEDRVRSCPCPPGRPAPAVPLRGPPAGSTRRSSASLRRGDRGSRPRSGAPSRDGARPG